MDLRGNCEGSLAIPSQIPMCYLTKILDDTPNHSRPGNMDLQGNYKGLGMTRKTHHKFARKLQSTMINIYTQFSQIPHNFSHVSRVRYRSTSRFHVLGDAKILISSGQDSNPGDFTVLGFALNSSVLVSKTSPMLFVGMDHLYCLKGSEKSDMSYRSLPVSIIDSCQNKQSVQEE
ncbi:hypothetical protein YC2023_015967 [Brassica napus]